MVPLGGGVAAVGAKPLAGGCDEGVAAAFVFPLAHFWVRQPLFGGLAAAFAGVHSGGALRAKVLTFILALTASLGGGTKAVPVPLGRSSKACRGCVASARLPAALCPQGNGEDMAGCGRPTAAARRATVDARS